MRTMRTDIRWWKLAATAGLILTVVAVLQTQDRAAAEPVDDRLLGSADTPASVQIGAGSALAAADDDSVAVEIGDGVSLTLPVTRFVAATDLSAADLRSELEAQERHRRTVPLTVVGRVLGSDGPVEGASIGIGDRSSSTDASGRFVLAPVERTNRIAVVDATGHYSRTVGVESEQALDVAQVDLGDITLVPEAAGRHTMIFGGDSSLGRRYIDPAEAAARNELPVHDDAALIGVDSALEDTTAILRDLAAMVEPYDLVSINLETVVTDEPWDPQETQRFALYMLPESVDALADAGIDHVTLGNNHVWDYGEKGVRDTHAALDSAGILYSGSGADADEAFEPSIIESERGGVDIAIHSWVAIENIPAPYPPHATITKGGGASLDDLERVAAEVQATEAADLLTVAVPHVGYEYTEQPAPSDPVQFVQTRLYTAADAGADLVIAHHPHLAQGFEFREGTLIAHSLGNLIFDQPRLDTLYGAMLAVAFDGQELTHARVEPVYIEGFVPTLATGEPADLLLRRLAWMGSQDVVIAPDAGAGRILERDDAHLVTREVTIPVDYDDLGQAMVDLRTLRLPGESIGGVAGVDPAAVSLGRDIMVLGDMEDHDHDDDPAEIRPWNFGSSSLVCGSEARRGAGALCSIRASSNADASTFGFGQRIRVVGDRINEPNRDLTLLLYERGYNRGDLVVHASYRASQGSRQFGDEVLATLPARSGDYAEHWLSVNLPPENLEFIEELPPDRPFRMRPQFRSARAVRLSFEHQPPAGGTGMAVLDDVALVSWEAPELLDGAYRTPSPFDFLRLRVGEREPPSEVTVTFHRWSARPAEG